MRDLAFTIAPGGIADLSDVMVAMGAPVMVSLAVVGSAPVGGRKTSRSL